MNLHLCSSAPLAWKTTRNTCPRTCSTATATSIPPSLFQGINNVIVNKSSYVTWYFSQIRQWGTWDVSGSVRAADWWRGEGGRPHLLPVGHTRAVPAGKENFTFHSLKGSLKIFVVDNYQWVILVLFLQVKKTSLLRTSEETDSLLTNTMVIMF